MGEAACAFCEHRKSEHLRSADVDQDERCAECERDVHLADAQRCREFVKPCPNHPCASTLEAVGCNVCGAFKLPGRVLSYPDDVPELVGCRGCGWPFPRGLQLEVGGMDRVRLACGRCGVWHDLELSIRGGWARVDVGDVAAGTSN